MLVICGLLFYVSRFIIRKLEGNFRRCYLLAANNKYVSVLAGTICNAIAPCLSRQLAFKLSETSVIFHQQNCPPDEGKDSLTQESLIPYPEGLHSMKVLIETAGRKRANQQHVYSGLYPNQNASDGSVSTVVRSKVSNMLFDTASGLLFYITIWNILPPDMVSFYFIQWRDATHQFLNRLLDWLMGAPAGLKLNHEMTVFFGNFFVYHVYIWIGYLSILEPYYISIIKALLNSSLLGLSIMLSLASDTLRFLTFHTYCFYVYAAKVYKLQLKALMSLSRLMRGKKWNPLRKRVDSIPYDASQLAFGTIIFTILLFLLPTTGIYYLVFTLLRLPVVVLTTVAFCSVRILNTVPVHEILARVFMSKGSKDKLSLNLCYGGQSVGYQNESLRMDSKDGSLLHLNNSVSLSVRFYSISFQKLLLRKTDFGFQNLLPFHGLLKSLLLGDIVDMVNTE